MIKISKVCGCCSGAKNAIDKALELSETNDKVYVYKEILHNKNVIDVLEKKGIKCVDDLEEARDGVVVIRAHGEGKETYDYLDKNGYKYVDATCVNVIRIHDIIKEKYDNGYSVIIIGKKNHPEVIGSNGWCCNNGFIIEDENDIDNLTINNDKILVICQTTFNKGKAEKYIEKIKEKYPCIEVVNSICNASVTIQKYSLELAKESDIMIVIGGKNSSNTKELYNIVSDVTTSYMVSSKEELISLLKEIKIDKDTNIGITAGASTMRSEIEEYVDIINFYIDYKDVVNKCVEYQKESNSNIIKEEKNEIVGYALEQLARMNSSGKYIRAYLISLAYHLFGNTDDNYLALSNAYELFQTSILIHDDIIDSADKRRGKDTIPVCYKNKYNQDNLKLGNDLAICIADYGFYYANKMIVEAYKDNKYLNDVLLEFNKIVLNTIKGEILDVELPYVKNSNNLEEQVLNIYSLKTSWYTILGPFRLGMLLSGNNTDIYDELLHDLGICFQIKDDILGVFGDSNNIGKTLSDIEEGKQTILYSYVIKTETYKDELLKYYGKSNLTTSECEKVKEIFINSGALDYAKRKENELIDKIFKKFDIIDIDNKYKSILKGFMCYLQHRDK